MSFFVISVVHSFVSNCCLLWEPFYHVININTIIVCPHLSPQKHRHAGRSCSSTGQSFVFRITLIVSSFLTAWNIFHALLFFLISPSFQVIISFSRRMSQDFWLPFSSFFNVIFLVLPLFWCLIRFLLCFVLLSDRLRVSAITVTKLNRVEYCQHGMPCSVLALRLKS